MKGETKDKTRPNQWSCTFFIKITPEGAKALLENTPNLETTESHSSKP